MPGAHVFPGAATRFCLFLPMCRPVCLSFVAFYSSLVLLQLLESCFCSTCRSNAIVGGVLEGADANINWKFRQPREIQLLTDMDFRVAGIRELFVGTSRLASA
jgi:hypothetical protein